MKEETKELANNHQIELTYSENEMIDGWVGRPKGMLQVLWERGWINKLELEKYSVDGKSSQKDEFGKVREEYKTYVLRTLMSKCLDFAREQSTMEYLLSRLSEKSGDHEFRLLTSPKYQHELAGEGVEYVWGLAKRYYHSKTIEEKRTKEKFHKIIRESVEFVRKEHVINFAAKCRRNMMAYYNAYDSNGDPLTYKMIGRFVKMAKTHRNIADQD